MAAKPKKHRVTLGNLRITIYRWTHPTTGAKRWRYAYRDGERWRYVTCETLTEADTSAQRRLEEMAGGGLAWSTLPAERRRWLEEVHQLAGPDEERAVLDFLRSRRKSSEVVAAVARFVAWKKVEAGEETPHLGTVRRALEEMAGHFAGRQVADIHAPELAEWWDDRCAAVGPKRKKDVRAALAGFWRWARREGIAGADPVTPADRLPTPKVGAGERRVLTPEEMQSVLKNIRQEWRAWAVLGAFAGLRPEEICPAKGKKKAEKRGLRCEEIDWKFGVIRLPACVSKVDRPRIIPLSDACRAGLAWAGIEDGHQGPVCLRNPSDERELARLGRLVFAGPWPKDSLRHSYGSYRNAQLRHLDKVAEEMGTSVAMLHRHYHNPRSSEEGEAWFSIRPDRIILGSVGQKVSNGGERF